MPLSRLRQTLLLYAITALMLLMQSLALWHDVDHPFYVHESQHVHQHDVHAFSSYDLCHDDEPPHGESNAQCERYEAFANSPTLDSLPETSLLTTASIAVLISLPSVTLVSKQLRDAYAIRAPPYLFS